MVYGATEDQSELINIALEEEFKRLYEGNYSKIMRLCLGYVWGDKDMAKDLTQEVFIKVWNNLNSFRGDSDITTWIYRIAVNTCLMNLRKMKKHSTNEVISRDTTANTVYEKDREQQFQEMYRCIETLGTTNKAIILMELEGMPQKEIAQVMGLKHEAIRTRIHRIKEVLTKCVNHE